MRIALISDTHGNYLLALRALEQLGSVDLLIHLGDGCEDMDVISATLDIPTYVVAGNCDRSNLASREILFSVAGKSVLATHGDLYQVKSGLGNLVDHARALQADLVVYGHTHVALETVVNGLTLVNPGTLAKVDSHHSVATVTISGDKLSVEIVPVQQPQPQL